MSVLLNFIARPYVTLSIDSLTISEDVVSFDEKEENVDIKLNRYIKTSTS